MSADNWGICPKCNIKFKEDQEKAEELYGKIPVEEYKKMLSETKDPEDNTSTLREDYEVWTDKEGLFQVSYRCSCEKCGFEFNYEYKEKLKL